MKPRNCARIQWITLAVILPCFIATLFPLVGSIRIRENGTAPVRIDSTRYLVDTGGVPIQFIRQSANSDSKIKFKLDDGPTAQAPIPQAQYYSTENPTDLVLQYFVKSQDSKPKAKTVTVGSSERDVEYTSLLDDDSAGKLVTGNGGSKSISFDDSEEASYEDYFKPEEATTIKVPIIPPALRRNFASLVDPTQTAVPETETGPFTPLEGVPGIILPEKNSRKKNKINKNGNGNPARRRKIKRPKDKTSTTEPVTAALQADLGEAENPDKDTDGDKNLAVEITSPDGKYALIHHFFNGSDPERPGIVSYASSENFPKVDNRKTLGNLQESDIWLAEGHLLVLKGGDFDDNNNEQWPPIDNYQRKKKPVLRIPLDSNNPPPFPVFVNKTGPPVFLREPPPFLPYPPPGFFGNESDFDPSQFPPPGMVLLNPNGTLPFPPPGIRPGPIGNGRPVGPGGGRPVGPGVGLFGPANPGGVNGGGLYGNKVGGVYGGGSPVAGPNKGGGRPILPPYPFEPPPPGFNGSFPPAGPFPGKLPPNFLPPPPGFNPNFNGSDAPPFPPFAPPLVLNPADNETDDPSIFLPPPYDFDYYEDNSTLVPPGPFAPGLVVPPPKDFYTVFNRTGRPPIATTPRPFFPTSTAIPTTVEAVVTSPVTTTKKQRPNAKKPKFPMTEPPDDSLEELYPIVPVTTPIPQIGINAVTIGTKKRKQRPKKPFFPQDSTSDYSTEDDEKSHVLPPSSTPRNPGSIIYPTYDVTPVYSSSPSPVEGSTVPPSYKVVIQTTARPFVISTTRGTTSPRPVNNFVYVQGRLKSLEEIAAEEEEKYKVNQPSTPAPPFDERGYPTRVLDEDTGPVYLEYQPKKVEPPRQRKPTEAPLKTYYTGTPKYDPNYVPNYSSNGNKPPQNPDTSIQFNPTPIVFQEVYPSARPAQSVSNQGQGNQRPIGPIYIQNLPQPPAQQQPIYTQQNYNQQQQPIGPSGPPYTVDADSGNQYVQPIPKRKRPKTRIRINPSASPDVAANPNQDYNAPIYNPQVTSGFRPAYPPPQQPTVTPTRNYNGENNRARFLFPGQVQQQLPVNSAFYNLNALSNGNNNKPLQNFAPNGYYNPITNFYQPGANQFSQPFVPSRSFPLQQQQQQQQRPAPQQQQFNPYSLPVTEPYNNVEPTHSPVALNHLLSGLNVSPYRHLIPNFGTLQGQQQLQPQPQQQLQQQYNNNPATHSQRIIQQPLTYNQPTPQSQSGGFNQYSQPLYDDVRVNYREPIPLYNTESESIAPRASSLKAGPVAGGEKEASGSAPSGTFYSFQRGGPGGFSYKIRL